MEHSIIRRHFEAIGARVKFRDYVWRMWRGERLLHEGYTVDIATDRRGSYFDIAVGRNVPDFEVLQTRPKERHLLLFSRDGQRFLCGHDERDWFVAGIPEAVSTVRDAKRALMPPEVRRLAGRVRPSATTKRKNRVFKRQGEWFFVPTDREFPEEFVLHHEPLQRTAGSKPHICEELVRSGGELVYLVDGGVYRQAQYWKKRKEDALFSLRRAETRVRNPEVYVRRSVRHPDHATLRLDCWHRVRINAELIHGTSVTFLD